jgi:ATP-dependent Clp protease adaptor protein ClpS
MTVEAITMAERRDDGTDEGTGLATKTRTRTKQPTPYRVLMLNDDYTPMEFVVLCLQRFFRMNMEEATAACPTFTPSPAYIAADAGSGGRSP